MTNSSHASSGSETLFTGYAGRLSSALSVGWLVVLLGRETLPPLVPSIVTDLSISSAQIGVALTVMWIVYSLAQYPSGRLSDALSRKTIIAFSLVVMLCGFSVLTQATSYAVFVAGMSLVGVGAGSYYIPSRALLTDLYENRRGQAFGLQAGAGSIGSALAPGVVILALTYSGWRATFVPILVILAVILATLHLLNREPYIIDRPSLEVRSTATRMFRSSYLRQVVVAYSLFVFAWNGVVSFLPVFLQQVKGFSPLLANAGFSLIFVVGMITGPIAGTAGDWFDRPRIAVLSLFVGLVGLYCLVATRLEPFVLIGVGLFALGLRAFPPVMQAYLMGLFPDDSVGGDLGALKSVYTGVGSFGPAFVGVVSQRLDYTAAYTGLGVVLAIATVLIFWLVVLAND